MRVAWSDFEAKPRLLTIRPANFRFNTFEAIGELVVDFTDRDSTLVFQVLVVPRAARTEIVGEHNGALRVRIAAAPVEGAANAELVKVLAKTFGVPRSAVEIARGHTAKLKTVKITHGNAEILTIL